MYAHYAVRQPVGADIWPALYSAWSLLASKVKNLRKTMALTAILVAMCPCLCSDIGKRGGRGQGPTMQPTAILRHANQNSMSQLHQTVHLGLAGGP